jgi:hypothetical protein
MSDSNNETGRLFTLLMQAENLQHNRVYYSLVAQTIFFLAVGTVSENPYFVALFSIAGLGITFLFGYVNNKTSHRVQSLIDLLSEQWPVYKKYINFDNQNQDSGGIPDSIAGESAKGNSKWKFQNRNIFVWWLPVLFGLTWLGCLGYATWRFYNPAPNIIKVQSIVGEAS